MMSIDSRLYRRNTDPDTSHEAAEALQPEALWRLILEYLAAHDRPQGWTEAELVDPLGIDAYALSKRLSDVRREGLAAWAVDQDGRKIKRPGPTNRNQGATFITTKGRRYIGSPS